MSLSAVPTTSPILDAAIQYVRRGWFILPINPAPGGSASEDEVRRAKSPCLHNGVDGASDSIWSAEGWFGENSKFPGARVGIAVDKSGLLVIDADSMDAYAELLDDFPEIERTLAVKTRRGIHMYFRASPGIRSARHGWRPKIDIQAGNVYVLAPPSPHVDGEYEFIDNGFSAPVELSAALVAAIGSGRQERSGDGWKSAGTGIPAILNEGDRRRSLLQVAGTLARSGVTAEEMRPTLEAINEARAGNSGPLPQSELEDVLAAGDVWADEIYRPTSLRSLRVVHDPDGLFHFWSP